MGRRGIEQKRTTDNVINARARGVFNKITDLYTGDNIKLPSGGIGEYVRISADKDRRGITVTYYPALGSVDSAKEVPSKIEFTMSGRIYKYPVHFSGVEKTRILKKPDHPSYSF